MSNQRIRSMRPQNDPQKPCNVAFREGLEAKNNGRTENACPYDANASDSYTVYLRAYWLNGFHSTDGVNHHEAEGR